MKIENYVQEGYNIRGNFKIIKFVLYYKFILCIQLMIYGIFDIDFVYLQ